MSGKRGFGDEDFVTWMLREFHAAAPAIPAGTILDLERRARVQWGGERTYIQRRTAILGVATGDVRGGVPYRTFYRWIARGG